MTEAQHKHIQRIEGMFFSRMREKYEQGATEHTGDKAIWHLSPLALVNEAIDEAIDQVVYLMTLRDVMYDHDHNHDVHDWENEGGAVA